MSNLPEGEEDRLIYLNNIFLEADLNGYEVGDYDAHGEWFQGTDVDREQKSNELMVLFDWAVENYFINKWTIPGDRCGETVWDWSSKAYKMAHELDLELIISMVYA